MSFGKGKLVSVILILLFFSVAMNVYFFAKGSSYYKEEAPEEAKEEIEVANMMLYFQHYATKLYFAGLNQNRDLVQFYLHELEEKAESFEKVGVVDEGKNISKLMKGIFLPVLDSFQTHPFLEAYTLMVTKCNQCHEASGYPFIRITNPEKPAFTNQQYKVDNYE